MAVNFDDILLDDIGITYYTRFAGQSYVLENISYMLDVLKFQGIPPGTNLDSQHCNKLDNHQTRREKALHIYKTYLQTDSVLEINISSQSRRQMKLVFERCNSFSEIGVTNDVTPDKGVATDIFDGVTEQVRQNMLHNSWPRFKESDMWREMALHALLTRTAFTD